MAKLKIHYGQQIIRPEMMATVSLDQEPSTVSTVLWGIVDWLQISIVFLILIVLASYEKFDPNAFLIGFAIGLARGVK